MTFNAEYFKRRIQQLRRERGQTYDDLAEGIGLTHSGVYSLLKGDRAPSMSTFVRICEFYNQPPEVFFNKHQSSINTAT